MTRLGADIFERAGATADEALAISANLVNSNLNGHDSHGVVRIPRYLMWEDTGNLAFGQSATVVADGDNFALIDGNRGFGQVVGREAVDIGIEKAKAHGVSIMALRNAGHLGRIGFWAERACDAGLVSVSFVNVACSMLVAPFGAADRRVSTAPVTIGVVNPSGDESSRGREPARSRRSNAGHQNSAPRPRISPPHRTDTLAAPTARTSAACRTRETAHVTSRARP